MYGLFEHPEGLDSWPWLCHVMRSTDATRVTIRLPTDTLEQLRDDLDSFNTETARFRYLVQLYFDLKDVGRARRACQHTEES